MCLRGSRSSSGSPGVPAAVDLVVAEGRLATSSEHAVTDSLSFSVGFLRFFFCRFELSDELPLFELLLLLLLSLLL